jgi:NADPH:quinone reductase-like Zn-dependent oxidoreductase
MKAIVQDTYGSTDVLTLREIDRPQIAADEVLVRVRAAGVDRGVWHLMTGLPYPIRLAGYGLRAPKTATPGMDLAGIVEAVGADVTSFRPGDEVFGIGKGSFADYARAPEGKLAPKPANLTFEQAAALGISGLTALQGLRDAAGVRPGQTVLILGASGGVGSFAVQLAKAFGAEVTGVCSTAKVEMVRALGADHVIDYTREEIGSGGRTYDVISTPVATGPSRNCVAPSRRRNARHRRRDRRAVARRLRPGAPARLSCAFRGQQQTDLFGEPGRPDRPEGADRGRADHAGRRPGVSAR